MTAPATLFDPVPGNLGLFTDHALFALRFDEPAGVLLSDELGNLADLQVDAGTTSPASEASWAGLGRRFVRASSTAVKAVDVAGRDTLSVRDMTVQAIVSLRAVVGTQTLFARGKGTSGAEALSACIELAIAAGVVTVKWRWADYAAAEHADAGASFDHPGDDKFLLLTCTRRWEAIDRVVLRYFVADQMIAEVVNANGAIAGATTATTMIGGRITGGPWGNFLNGVIDELVVTDHEMSPEEVREVWRRLTVYQPGGVETFAGLSPPGAPWYLDPGNLIGRKVKVVGQALGLAVAKTEELRALFLADAATIEIIPRWEHLLGLSPRPRDSLDVRRARVVGFLSRLQGYSIPAIKQAMSAVLDCDPDDLEILEFTNRIDDDFTTLELERWTVGDQGAWSVAAGKLSVTAAAGADLRYEPTRASCYVRTPLSGTDGAVILQGKLAAFWAAPALPLNALVGLFLHNRRSGNFMWFGVKNVGGVFKIGYVQFVDGALGAFQALATPASSAPYWLRIVPFDGEFVGLSLNQRKYVFGWSTTGPTTGFTTAEVVLDAHDWEWAGFGAKSTDAALASNLAASFDDIVIITPSGDRPFLWYVYRDPALGGVPDILGAQLLAQKLKPAHTYAGVCQNKSVLCNDARDGLCERGPMGAVGL